MRRIFLLSTLLPAVLAATGPTLLPPARADRTPAKGRKKKVDGRKVGEVVVDRQTVIRFYSGAGGLSPVERAKVVSDRLNGLDYTAPVRSSELDVRNALGLVRITMRNTSIVTVTRDDAEALRLPPRDVANLWAANLTSALEGEKVAKIAVKGRRDDRKRDEDP